MLENVDVMFLKDSGILSLLTDKYKKMMFCLVLALQIGQVRFK